MAASIMGILSATFLDRFGRRAALTTCFWVIGCNHFRVVYLGITLPCSLVRCLEEVLFGGPTSALACGYS